MCLLMSQSAASQPCELCSHVYGSATQTFQTTHHTSVNTLIRLQVIHTIRIFVLICGFNQYYFSIDSKVRKLIRILLLFIFSAYGIM